MSEEKLRKQLYDVGLFRRPVLASTPIPISLVVRVACMFVQEDNRK